MLKTSFVLFLTVLSLLLLNVAEGKNLKYWGLAGCVLGLIYATHQQIGVFIAGVSLYLLVVPSRMVMHASVPYRRSLSGRLAETGMLSAGILLALLPFAARNYAVAAKPSWRNRTGNSFLPWQPQRCLGRVQPVDGIRQNSAGHYYDAKRIAEKEEGRQLSPSDVRIIGGRRLLRIFFGES